LAIQAAAAAWGSRLGWLALVVGLIAGVIIGFGMGWLRARVGIPSFVITLATFLAF
jgi:D-xylose transport system permease protein